MAIKINWLGTAYFNFIAVAAEHPKENKNVKWRLIWIGEN